MKQAWNRGLIKLGRLVAYPPFWRFIFRYRTRYILSWLIAVVTAGSVFYVAWILFDNDASIHRRDGNGGHATIDFGGQYLMGRMLVKGFGKHLYDRNYQRQVLYEAYPEDDEDPDEPGLTGGPHQRDAEKLMSWIMGDDPSQSAETIGTFLIPLSGTNSFEGVIALAVDIQIWQPAPSIQLAEMIAPLGAADPLTGSVLVARVDRRFWHPDRLQQMATPSVGGPLYPPINSFVYYPLALLTPHTAYRVNQVLGLLLALVAGLAFRSLSAGRVWLPIACVAVMGFPGFDGSLNLGQNAALTLAILMGGWALIASNRPWLGGLIWGLLAFKPVWAASFFLVPLIMRRWRICVAMLGTAATLILLTLPFVGLHSWFDWLKVGREATRTYQTDVNWILLSRDLLSIPRRWFDFDNTSWSERADNLPMAIGGWIIWMVAFELTVRLGIARGHSVNSTTGPEAAFLLFGAWLSCFHFMYYDVLLAALPVLLLFTNVRNYLEPKLLAIVPLNSGQTLTGDVSYYRPSLPITYLGLVTLKTTRPQIWVVNRMFPTLALFLIIVTYLFPVVGCGLRSLPYDTFCLAAFWVWCGWLWTHSGTQEKESPGSEQLSKCDGAKQSFQELPMTV